MRIALDATPLSAAGGGGIRRYTGELAPGLAREFPDDELWLVSDQQFPCIAGGLANLRCGRAPATALERRWWSYGLPRELSRLEADVFHGTDFTVPYRAPCATVMTVHDLSPWRPEFADETSTRVRRRTAALLRLRRPTMVITPTNAIRSELIERFNYEPGRVVAVPLAASAEFRSPEQAPQEIRHHYFIYVGGSQARKNQDVITDAWRDLRRTRDVDLLQVGGVLKNVTDTELARLYSGAVACLIPSHYEGFGIPLIEAMQCGCPVVASRDPALLEVSGGAAEHADAVDGRSWRALMERLLDDDSLRAALRERGLARVAAFSWKRTAQLTREVYAEAIRRVR